MSSRSPEACPGSLQDDDDDDASQMPPRHPNYRILLQLGPEKDGGLRIGSSILTRRGGSEYDVPEAQNIWKTLKHTHTHTCSCFRTSFWFSDFRRRPPAPSHRAWKYNVVYLVDSSKSYFNIFGLNQLHIRAPELIWCAFCAESRSKPIGTTPGPPNQKCIEHHIYIYIYIYMGIFCC